MGVFPNPILTHGGLQHYLVLQSAVLFYFTISLNFLKLNAPAETEIGLDNSHTICYTCLKYANWT